VSAPVDRLAAALADRYRLGRELGQGGMATVYLAEDLKHDRKVAIKVLHPELSAVLGAERFLTEIKTTANLQHPHILGLIDSGSADGLLYYVMPFVDGETLRARLVREQQLPVKEAVRIATETASALEYAHRRGVIHRDIKPENILLQDGQVLVADFGIALAVSQAGGQRMTQTGLSLGTPSYMSPEQATGEKTITARSDVYALGAMTYEMLMGDPPFAGSSAQAIIAQILTARPRPLRDFRSNVPEHVEQAVLTALEKLPADRFESAKEFAGALAQEAASGARPVARTLALPGAGATSRRGRPWPWLAGAAALSGLAFLAGRAGRGTEAPAARPVVRFTVDLGADHEVRPSSVPLVAPDGRTLYVSGGESRAGHVIVRALDRDGTTTLAGVRAPARPFLSPDGRWVGFTDVSQGRMFKVPASGGAPVPITPARWGGATWGRDGTIVFAARYDAGLSRVSQEGGPVTQLTHPDTARGELGHWWPQFLPDGRHVLFCAYASPLDRARIEALDLETGKRTVIVEGGLMPRYVASGHLLYARNATLMAVPFDPATLRTMGSAVPVVEGIAGNYSDGQVAYDVGMDGTLVYLSDSLFGRTALIVETDRDGTERLLLPEPGSYEAPRLSPDRTRLAYVRTDAGDPGDVWIRDLARGAEVKVAGTPARDFGPTWTPDGRELLYGTEQSYYEIFRRPADLSRPAVQFSTSGGGDKSLSQVTSDGRLAVFAFSGPQGGELWTGPLDGSTPPARWLAADAALGHPVISPDGRWIAYDGNESGTVEVYIQSWPDPSGARRQISSGGASEPLWS
jgi:serine/threonine-protein kinase